MDSFLGGMDALLEWMSTALHQTATSYCELETADNNDTLVARDGSLVSVLRLDGAKFLVGSEEFERLHESVRQSLQTGLARKGHTLQVCFVYDKDAVKRDISDIFSGAHGTAKRLNLELEDLFDERVNFLSRYCAKESCYLALWTRPDSLSKKQLEQAKRNKVAKIKKNKLPPMRYAQSIVAGIPELRDTHRSFVRSTYNDLSFTGLNIEILDVHDAIRCVRETIDSEFTDQYWRPVLPGDKIPVRFNTKPTQDISEIMWPSLGRQLFPRDGENLDLHHVRLGNRIYASIFIDLFPQEVKRFSVLFNRAVSANLPWRISYLVDSDGLSGIRFKSLIAAILSFASSDNPLISDSKKILQYIETNSDDPVVKLRVALATWAPVGEMSLLKQRHAELAKAVQGWGYCEVSELSGDPFGGALSSSLALNANSYANASVAPFSDVSLMFPFTRPSSSWTQGALLFRSPDGKPWPYQPGSSRQTTWIDLIYARPGSGKSVLSNAINLGLCLNPGNQRLPRISIIDIGPSSSGLISLISEALPPDRRHLAAYHRLRMTPDFSINPFDTQLGSRHPTPLERSFLVNFMALLGTPLGSNRPYDGIVDMAGMVIDEMYKQADDTGTPHLYAQAIEPEIDKLLEHHRFKFDAHTSWWEVTDFLFENGLQHEALLAQRHAVPLVADAASACRLPAIDDLFGNVTAPTGETLIQAFGRMISSAVREYPILGRVTQFDIGDARIVSLDLDEVAKTGGEAADRQTAIMYMIARYVLARDYYLTPENVNDLPRKYRDYHRGRILEIREDAKRIVFDEFHRTANADAVRNQVIVDMREGRKWKVQVALLSQSLDDFDPVMVDFATSVFIMDAGPKQAIDKSAAVFGLSETAKTALRTRVHGPREGGGTFLAQFSTKDGVNTQLLTNTIGPIELWAFSTTAEDTRVRNELYTRLGPRIARKVLGALYPTGTIAPIVEKRLMEMQEEGGLGEESGQSILQQLIDEIINEYRTNPLFGAIKTTASE
jgi:intracellular multiplication protein IcmB